MEPWNPGALKPWSSAFWLWNLGGPRFIWARNLRIRKPLKALFRSVFDRLAPAPQVKKNAWFLTLRILSLFLNQIESFASFVNEIDWDI